MDKLIKYLDIEAMKTLDEIKFTNIKLQDMKEKKETISKKMMALDRYYSPIGVILAFIFILLFTVNAILVHFDFINLVLTVLLDVTLSGLTVIELKNIIHNKKILGKKNNFDSKEIEKLQIDFIEISKDIIMLECKLSELKIHFGECYESLNEISYLNNKTDIIIDDLKNNFIEFSSQKIDYSDINFNNDMDKNTCKKLIKRK